ncbi:MAG: SCP2 sterol-binding domain-containing protein, partial [Acidimicrobiia bacterium]
AVELALGEVDNPDATIKQSYETAVAIERGRLGAQTAFMQGKLQVSGNLMKLMNLQTVFQTLPQAIGRLEREY